MKKDNNKGFTFIELILYMAILGIFMVAVVTMVSSTVATNRKQTSRQKLQSQATETYDMISNMLMGASDIKINGDAYVGDGTSYSLVTNSSFIVPDDTYQKSSGAGSFLKTSNGISNVTQSISSASGAVSGNIDYCYDIADVKPFGGQDASKDAQTFIEADYLWIEYASALDKVCYCTIKYDETAKKLYIAKVEKSESEISQAKSDIKSGDPVKKANAQNLLNLCGYYVDESSEKGTLLAKNVSSFQLQVNPDDDSIALIIGFEDTNTNQKYNVTGVVGFRNSFVLEKHEWD